VRTFTSIGAKGSAEQEIEKGDANTFFVIRFGRGSVRRVPSRAHAVEGRAKSARSVRFGTRADTTCLQHPSVPHAMQVRESACGVRAHRVLRQAAVADH
jgi:hypothetical protein